MTHLGARRRSVGLGLLVMLALPACGRAARSDQYGLKRVSLNLASTNGKPAVGVPPSSVQAGLISGPAPVAPPPAVYVPPTYIPGGRPTFPPFIPPCPKAPKTARPTNPATNAIERPPAPGIYTAHNVGTFDITGLINFKGQYPIWSAFEVANIRMAPAPAGTSPTSTPLFTYDVIQGGPGATVTTTYQVTATELDLVSVVQKVNGTTTTFAPTPAVTLMHFGGIGDSWTSAGIDSKTGTVMVVQGLVKRAEVVDVCGNVYDSLRVESKEQVDNLVSGYHAQTDTTDPNVYNVATQLGGLFVREHIHTTTTATINGTPTTITLNYTSVLNSVTPIGRNAP